MSEQSNPSSSLFLPGKQIPYLGKDSLLLVKISDLEDCYRQGFQDGKNTVECDKGSKEQDQAIVHQIPTPGYLDPHYRSFLRRRTTSN